jgi:hypothetical protein
MSWVVRPEPSGTKHTYGQFLLADGTDGVLRNIESMDFVSEGLLMGKKRYRRCEVTNVTRVSAAVSMACVRGRRYARDVLNQDECLKRIQSSALPGSLRASPKTSKKGD